ncbi:MAG: SMP-30/gluconolactonase/LRE family protein [Leptolyngbya sp. PLA1]|nr:SMP-30/gluconolactonase/LRE family protein [Leptolyngbya sp. PLA1]
MMNVLSLVLVLLTAGPAQPQGTTPAPAAQPTPPGPGAFFEEAQAKVIGKGYAFTEGPCWVPARDPASKGFFLFCDVPASTVLRWNGGADTPVPFRTPSGKALGTAVDASGNLYFAECEGRQITRVAIADGTPQPPVVLASKLDGKRLNATNDLVVASDGSVYFTDPSFFTAKKDLELEKLASHRIAPDGSITLITDALRAPNGIALSLDEKAVFINDFGGGKIVRVDIQPDGSFASPTTFADLRALAKAHGLPERGNADGLRLDANGNIYTTGPGGILVLSPQAELLATLPVPGASNLAFGGEDGKTLIITAGGSVLSIRATHAGAPWKKAADAPKAPAMP